MSQNIYIFRRISGDIGSVWLAAPASSLLIAFRVELTCQSSSGKVSFIALWINLIEENMFFRESYEMLADSSLANAIRISLLVGQNGFLNFVQNNMNCRKLLRWFLLVPSAYKFDWERNALSRRCWN